nr:hypothetical protein [Tanacetum cinerariifolium]
ALVINKCLTGKSSGIDRVEHKNQKRSNEIYYPRFTKVIIDYFMTRKPSISIRNRINWHYVRDDVLFSTIKVVSRHQTTQQYGAILPIELTTDDIRNKGDEQTKGREESEGDKTDKSDDDDDDETVKAGSESDKHDDYNDDEEEPTKNDDEDTESGKGGDEVSESEGESDEEETRQEEEESFDPNPRHLKEVRMKAMMRRIRN